MSSDVNPRETIKSVLKMASLFGKGTAVTQAQTMLMPHILRVFSQHDHTELERMILTNYPLVEEKTPEKIRNALDNLGSDPEVRAQYEGVVLELITPENILNWLRNPDEWLDEEEANRQREELRWCAEVIEETEGGEEWLEEQVLDLYRMANIVPNTSKTLEAND